MDLCKKEDAQSESKPVVCYFSEDVTESYRGRESPVPDPTMMFTEQTILESGGSSLQEILLAQSQLRAKRLEEFDIEDIHSFLEQKHLLYDSQENLTEMPVGLKKDLGYIGLQQSDLDWSVKDKLIPDESALKLLPVNHEKKSVLHMDKVVASKPERKKPKTSVPPFRLTGFETLIKLWDLDAWRLNC